SVAQPHDIIAAAQCAAAAAAAAATHLWLEYIYGAGRSTHCYAIVEQLRQADVRESRCNRCRRTKAHCAHELDEQRHHTTHKVVVTHERDAVNHRRIELHGLDFLA